MTCNYLKCRILSSKIANTLSEVHTKVKVFTVRLG